MSVIDIVQLGFSLKNNSDAITNKLLNDLKKIQEAGKIKIEIDDSKIKDTLAALDRLANGNLKGLRLRFGSSLSPELGSSLKKLYGSLLFVFFSSSFFLSLLSAIMI